MTKSELRSELLKEHSKRQCNEIVRWVDESEDRFASLFSFILGSDDLLAQRAAWPITYLVENHPHLILPYKEQVVDLLKQKRHPAIRRNLLRALRFVDLDDDFAGHLVDICVDFTLDNKKPNAIRANALELYTKITLMYPDLLPETLAVLDEVGRSEKPSLRSAVRKAKRKLRN